jgi:hypothetical protein
MIKLKDILMEMSNQSKPLTEKPDEMIKEQEDYRGPHTAPGKTSSAPLYDLTKIYPDDEFGIYSKNAARCYGDNGGDDRDKKSVSMMQFYRNKPNAEVKIYRAVPNIHSEIEDKIRYYNKLRKYFIEYGFPPMKDSKENDVFRKMKYNKQEYLDKLNNDIKIIVEKHKKNKLKINPGDWVTLNLEYAIEHGKNQVKGNYKILSLTVTAKELYSSGDSVHEFGYVPKRKPRRKPRR